MRFLRRITYLSAFSQYYLIQHGIANKTLYNIKRNCYISTSTLEKLCKIMNCTPNDIIRFANDC
ncbi:MAG: helix-turn-helix transcriptional regulator [Hungatella sp.]|nr:helix-turn-helix transcriptional regulator [Hungatella sp.]